MHACWILSMYTYWHEKKKDRILWLSRKLLNEEGDLVSFVETQAVNQHSRDSRYCSYHALIKPLSKYELLQTLCWPMNIPTATEINTRASCALSAVILTSYHTVIKHSLISDHNEVLSLNLCHLSHQTLRLLQCKK